MPHNWEARERKQSKKRYGMKVTGRSVFVIEEATQKRDRKFIEKTQDKRRKGKQ